MLQGRLILSTGMFWCSTCDIYVALYNPAPHRDPRDCFIPTARARQKDKLSPREAGAQSRRRFFPVFSHVLTTKGTACHWATHGSSENCLRRLYKKWGCVIRREVWVGNQPGSSFTPVSGILRSLGYGICEGRQPLPASPTLLALFLLFEGSPPTRLFPTGIFCCIDWQTVETSLGVKQ